MENIAQWAATLADKRDGIAFEKVLAPFQSRMISASLASAGLAIKAGGGVLVKVGAADWYGLADGVLVLKAAATDMPALVGTITADAFNVYVFAVDSAGTVTTYFGTEGAALATIVFPDKIFFLSAARLLFLQSVLVC